MWLTGGWAAEGAAHPLLQRTVQSNRNSGASHRKLLPNHGAQTLFTWPRRRLLLLQFCRAESLNHICIRGTVEDIAVLQVLRLPRADQASVTATRGAHFPLMGNLVRCWQVAT